VAFRDSDGRIGLVDEFCPHRRVSLFFGRNEECGLRCVYHGWKVDVEGNCLDQLNEPPEHQFKQHIHLTAYPTVELGGLVWAYLGPADKMPPPPKFAWTKSRERAGTSRRSSRNATGRRRWKAATTRRQRPTCHLRLPAPLTEEDRREYGIGNGPDFVDQKTFRSKQNRSNNYGIDREVQRTESFTGIDGINQQDRALQESMGPIVDRSKEHLGPADKAIG